MKRTLCPGELRFMSLAAGPGASPIWAAGPAAGVMTGAIGAGKLGIGLGLCVGLVTAGVATAVAYTRRPPIERNAKLLTAAIDICPWGVVSQRGPFRWADFSAVHHLTRRVERRRETIIVNLLYFELSERSYLQAQSEVGDTSLVQVLHPRFVRAAGRDIAVALDDRRGLPGDTEGLSRRIVEAARRIVLAGEPSEWFERLETGSYRGASRIALTATASAALRRGLLEEPQGDVDLAPLQAAILAECGVTGATQELLELTMSPNVVVAATARAAAMRLGVSPVRTGPIGEVTAFLSGGEIAAWSAWAEEAGSPPTGASRSTPPTGAS